jgi:hypothetical protein
VLTSFTPVKSPDETVSALIQANPSIIGAANTQPVNVQLKFVMVGTTLKLLLLLALLLVGFVLLLRLVLLRVFGALYRLSFNFMVRTNNSCKQITNSSSDMPYLPSLLLQQASGTTTPGCYIASGCFQPSRTCSSVLELKLNDCRAMTLFPGSTAKCMRSATWPLSGQ